MYNRNIKNKKVNYQERVDGILGFKEITLSIINGNLRFKEIALSIIRMKIKKLS